MAVAVISRATTETVEPTERIGFWEDYNRKALVGLSCTSYSDRGLLARQTNFQVDGVRLAEIAGNAHVVERTPQKARSAPKDSVFATLLLKGEAVFLHEHGCLAVNPGDLVVYDTRRPYLFGFSSDMRQILVDIPREVFARTCLAGNMPAPMHFGRGAAHEGTLLSALRALLGGVLTPHGAASPPVPLPGAGGLRPGGADAILDLIRLLALDRAGDGAIATGLLSQLIIAEDYIERHLHDPCLTAGRVASVMGISARHLSRVFEPSGTTPSRFILQRRLERARHQLADSAARELTIADIAYRLGFSSQAHFARVFRAQFGRTPSEERSAGAGA
ncbi:helix-turn-helix domain-containing protein [Spongiactinospora sp. TRM90649]|uniref:helix-turn-helix domain-containing protein n=1 Tax=Spongiactinospora sp. TRM90649 TaxID=3031114 RepID=UPI0023F7DA4C|nr:helix-turn-helix domain-containing protein [Spongiactinospora sp. TRM90649]MDF5758286.1 helix-turn-helix domain-containing protein [Spongiactinospora sp. TRM90649]